MPRYFLYYLFNRVKNNGFSDCPSIDATDVTDGRSSGNSSVGQNRKRKYV